MVTYDLKHKLEFCRERGKRMLSGCLVLCEQEMKGDYSFDDELDVTSTRAFYETFGEETIELAYTSRALIQMRYDNPDRIQHLEYKGIKFKCICDFHKGDKVSDYEDLDRMYIVFMLEDET